MTDPVTLAVVQFAPADKLDDNLAAAEALVRQAAAAGAQIILLPELFCGPYFCTRQSEDAFARAAVWQSHPATRHMSALAAELAIVLPVSIFEKSGPEYFNTVVMIDAGGEALGIYRKSHIPDGPGYQEKFYFKPGDTGFQVWDTAFGRIGVGICWDQWFPEAARAMTLLGADMLLFPTAIGSEPADPALDTAARWQRAMQGHAVSNVIPVAAANRIGVEGDQTFYGSSFIADPAGEIVAALDRTEPGFVLAKIDPEDIARQRAAWGFFRDRRADLYDQLVRPRQT